MKREKKIPSGFFAGSKHRWRLAPGAGGGDGRVRAATTPRRAFAASPGGERLSAAISACGSEGKGNAGGRPERPAHGQAAGRARPAPGPSHSHRRPRSGKRIPRHPVTTKESAKRPFDLADPFGWMAGAKRSVAPEGVCLAWWVSLADSRCPPYLESSVRSVVGSFHLFVRIRG